MVIAFTGTRGLPYQASSDRLEYQVELAALELTKRNHSVHVLTDPEYSDLDSYQGISLHPTKSSAWATFATLLRIPKLDIVHVMSLDQAVLVSLVSIFMPHVRLIFSANHYHIKKSSRWAQWSILRRVDLVCRFADEILVNRVDLQDFFIERTDTPVHLVEQPLDIHLTRQNGSIKTWDLSRRKYVLIHSHHQKDQKTLRLLLISLAKSKLNYSVVVMGSVVPEIKAEFQSSEVLFVGTLNGQTEREVISNARWFIDTSSTSEDKTPLLMALAHATPIMVERTDLHRSWIGRNGLYYSRENLASMIHTLRFMEDHYALLSDFAYAQAPSTRESHSVETYFNRLIEIYVEAFTKKQTQGNEAQSLEGVKVPTQS